MAKTCEEIIEYDRLARGRYLVRRYGITSEEYDALFQQQDGKCAVCGSPNSKSKTAVGTISEHYMPMYVDHDHVTGRVRGLLCRECNAALGNLEDSEERLLQMLEYIKKWNL